MTNHRDPIEAWLSQDVELMPPPPGAFQRVHRRARRRKAVRTIGTAAGAAIIVAAAATLPQVASGLLPGEPAGGPNRVPTRTAPSTGHSGGTISPAPKTSSPPGSAPALSTAGKGPAPAAGFHPTSVTFAGNGHGAVLGAVLGAAGTCGTRPCTVMAGTRDYGLHWTKIGAPPSGPPDGSAGVSQVRFLSRADGWAYGPALYATHNGGATWHHVLLPVPGRVIDLSAVGSRAFAVVGLGCTGAGSDYTAGCQSFAMISTLADGDSWQLVRGAGGGTHVAPGSLQLTRGYGYLMTSGLLIAGPVSGGPWQLVSNAGPTTPSCLIPSARRGPRLIAPGNGSLFLVCPGPRANGATSTPLTLYLSRDHGRTWQQRGAVQASGTATSLAVSPAGTLVLATTATIYYLSPGAGTWHPANLATTPAGGFSFVGMTTASKGVAVPVTPGRAVFITRDGGLTWQAQVIR